MSWNGRPILLSSSSNGRFSDFSNCFESNWRCLWCILRNSIEPFLLLWERIIWVSPAHGTYFSGHLMNERLSATSLGMPQNVVALDCAVRLIDSAVQYVRLSLCYFTDPHSALFWTNFVALISFAILHNIWTSCKRHYWLKNASQLVKVIIFSVVVIGTDFARTDSFDVSEFAHALPGCSVDVLLQNELFVISSAYIIFICFTISAPHANSTATIYCTYSSLVTYLLCMGSICSNLCIVYKLCVFCPFVNTSRLRSLSLRLAWPVHLKTMNRSIVAVYAPWCQL